MRGWGLNTNYQVGDGTNVNRSTPVAVSGLTGVAAIAGGSNYSLAVKTDGTVWAWGSNGNGQFGDGTTTQRTVPSAVAGLTGVTSVAAGSATSYFVLSDGTVRATGYNEASTYGGALGNGSVVQQSLTPVVVTGVTSVVQIAAGDMHALVRKTDGTVWAWGSNGNGQIGDGTTATERRTAVQVTGLPTIASIGAGAYHSLAVGVDGSVWAWGRNTDGQIGDASQVHRYAPVQIAAAGMGWQMPAPVFNVAAGLYSASQTVTVTNNDPAATMRYTTTGVEPTTADPIVASGGTVAVGQSLTLKAKAWKSGYQTSLTTTAAYELKVVTPTLSPGTGSYGVAQNVTLATTTPGATIRYTTDATEPTPTSPLYAAAVNVASTLTLKARASKTGWTSSDSGAASYWISAGTVAAPTATPAAGTFAAAPLVTLASATSGATLRYTLDGSDPTATAPLYRYPFVVSATTTVKARAFKTGMTQSALTTAVYAVDAAGATATPTITPAGGVFTTRRTVTITGVGGATLRYTTTGADPTASDTLVPGGGQVVVDRAQILKVRAWAAGLTQSAVRRADFVITGAIAAGSNHTLALKEDGTVWAFGRNTLGQVGNGTIVDALSPVQVLTGAVAIATGTEHSLAVKADGTVWSWGRNDASQLGRTGTATTPAQMTGVTGAVAVAGGANHSLVLKADGTVWAVGANAAGQVGDGTTTMRSTAVAVLGLSGATAIAAGTDTSAAIQTNAAGAGWVFTWGKNTLGQLGEGSLLNRLAPVQVPLTMPALEVVAGAEMMAVRRSDLTVATWGSHAVGQLGIGASPNRSTPVVISVVPGVRHLATGKEHVLAHDTRGRVVAWGSNALSKFGAGADAIVASTTTPFATKFSSVLALSAGADHSVAITASGGVVAAGYGWSGSSAPARRPMPLPPSRRAPSPWSRTRG